MRNAEGPRDVVTIEHEPDEKFVRLVTRSRISEDGGTMHVEAEVTIRPAAPTITLDARFVGPTPPPTPPRTK